MFRIANRLLLGILALSPLSSLNSLSSPNLPTRLSPSEAIVPLFGSGELGELPRDESKVYRVAMKKGQLLHVSAKQIDVDVALALVDPAGNVLFLVDSTFVPLRAEQLFFVAPAEGVYGVRIQGGSKEKKAGRFILRLEEFRVASDRDRKNAQAETAYYTAKGLYLKGFLEEAEANLRYALQAWQELGNQTRQADGFFQLGRVRDATLDLEGALEAYRHSAALRAGLRDLPGRADALKGMARDYDQKGKFRQAKSLYSQEIEIRQGLGDEDGEIAALYNLAGVERSVGEFEYALDHFSQAIGGWHRKRDSDLESQALSGRSATYLFRGNG